MNIKGSGDEGTVTETTHEFVKKKDKLVSVKVEDNFASFSTVEKGFEGYLNLLQRNFSDATEALKDNSKTINDFSASLQNGKNGAYATDPKYSEKIESMFNNVVNDYTKEINNEITGVNSEINNLLSSKENFINQEKNILTDDASAQLLQLLKVGASLNNDLNELKKLK